jgi:hypothetical protein
MGEKQFKKLRRQQMDEQKKAANQQPGTPISELPPNVPGERMYRMKNGTWVEEKDLTREHMAGLALEFAQWFDYLPPMAQDMFLQWVDAKIQEAMTRQQLGQTLDEINELTPQPNVSKGGIILPDNATEQGESRIILP